MPLEADKAEIMAAVQRAVTEAASQAAAAATELAIAHHQNLCPISDMRSEHLRMYKEIFNGDDGEHGIANELRNWIGECRTTAKWKKRFWATVGTLAALFVAVMVYPMEQGWKDFDALMRLADKAPTIIRLTDDWDRYYNTPPGDEPLFKVTPPDPPAKKKPSYFDLERKPALKSIHTPPPPPAQDAQIPRMR